MIRERGGNKLFFNGKEIAYSDNYITFLDKILVSKL